MIKKAILAVIIIVCSSAGVYSQFTINVKPSSAEPAIEGEPATYIIDYSQLPSPHKIISSVTNGTIIDQNLEPDPKNPLHITVLWDCNPLNGSGDIAVSELLTNTSGTLNVFIRTFLSDATYCNRADPLKQNLLYGQSPAILKIITCSRYCNSEATTPYRYQWQVGDIAIGVFPQVPAYYNDIVLGTTSDAQANKPEYQPPAYYTDCIKAYRRITIVTDPGTGLDLNFYSEPAVISTFGQLNPGTISWQGIFNNGAPAINQTSATGGLCDGYNYIYTWEFSNDDINWTAIGSGVNYPSTLQVTGSGYLRRRVDCNTQTLYTNVLHIIIPTLNPGTISGSGTYAFNSIPAVSQTAASGGACNGPDYQYTWERSVNSGVWVSIGTSINYPQNAGIIADCQVRRKVHCVFEDAYTNTISLAMLPYSSPNTENLNYVRINDITVPGVQSWLQADAMQTGGKLQTTTYLNAFGYPLQTVVKQGSLKQTATPLDPNNINNYQDLVSITEYDELGRTDKSFLPYATQANLGFFKPNAHIEQQNFIDQKYAEPIGSIYTYSQSSFDGSPLNRVTNMKLPGAFWNNSPAYKGISNGYEIYKAIENVRVWNIGFNSGDKPIDAGAYPDGKLLKNISKDEKDKLIIEYKDLSGNVVLKKVQEKEIGQGLDLNGYIGWLCTYYVYDDFGRLRYTISPKAVAQLVASNIWVIDDAVKKGLCFYQEYDKKGRVIIKHSSDGGEVWLVYDNRDRLVLSQDENQRFRFPKQNQWSISLYDDNDRAVATGLIDDVRDRQAMEVMVEALNSNAQNRQITVYTGTWETITVYNPIAGNFPGSSAPAIITNSLSYYDEYKTSIHPFIQPANNDFAPTNNPYAETPALSLRIKGINTASKLRVLDAKYDNGNLNDQKFLLAVNYFDDKGRLIESFADHLKAGVDMSEVQYDFSGKALCTSGKHYLYGGAFDALFSITKYDYDILGRASKVWKLYTKGNSDISNLNKYKKLSELVLDEFGRVRSKQIGEDPTNPENPLETQDFSYNIQGWLTGINKDYALADGSPSNGMSSQWSRRFGMYLGYENADNRFTAPQWSGNITGVIWRSQGDNTPRKYNYEYDNINRFTAARFLQKDNPQASDNTYSTSKADLSAFVTAYDANGNITGSKQTGLVPGTNGGVLIDDLQYSYYANSNQLRSVNDLAFGGSNTQNGKQGDFKNFTPSTGIDYDYDKNGNLKNDKNKNIISGATDGIVSNFLDLPQQVIINGKSKTEYTYDAAGNKLAKKVTQLAPGSAEPITTYYIDGLVYEGQSPSPGATEALSLQYILNEEGKLRIIDPVAAWSGPSGQVNYLETHGNTEIVNTGTPNKWGVWDYFVKDNLGNTRMVLTEEYHQQQLLCSMEATPAVRKNEEEATFGNTTNNEVVNTRYSTTSLPWQPSPYVSKLIYVSPGVQPPTTIGPNSILKVMAGDILNGTAKYYYQSPGQSNNINNNIILNIANSLFGFLQSPGNVSAVIKDNISNNFLSSNGGPLQPFLTDNNPAPANTKTPKAFLNYIFFDEQFRYVKECSGAIPVPQLQGSQTSSSGDLQPFSVKATKNGYVYIYLSNESSNVPVYFDDFRVTHTRGPIVEDNAFYPFGLKIQGISAKAALKPQTKYGYQGDNCERDDETGYDEFALRSYDPQTGRWIEVDPEIVQPGMYNGMGNDPINMVDPTGGEENIFGKKKGPDGHYIYSHFDGSKLPEGYLPVGYGETFSELGTGKIWQCGSNEQFNLVGQISVLTPEPVQFSGNSVNRYSEPLREVPPVNSESSGVKVYVPSIGSPAPATMGSYVERRSLAEMAAVQQSIQDWRYSNGYDSDGFESRNWTWRLIRDRGFQNFSEKLLITSTLISGTEELLALKSALGFSAKDYAYRALNTADQVSVNAGEGVFAKAQGGSWTVEEHLINGSRPSAFQNNPWIATSADYNIAKAFSSGKGIIRVDLTKVTPGSAQKGWLMLPRSSPGYHYSIWQQEISIYGHIPQNAIKVIK